MTPCNLWTGATNADGYGVVRVGGRVEYVHRLAYRLHVGPIPRGHEIAHTCDTPACREPSHLVAMTHKQNMNDAARKGRLGRRRVA